MILLSDAGRDYLQHNKLELGYAKRTLQTYSAWFHHFEKWLQDQGHDKPDLSVFNTGTLRRYLYHLSARVRPRTVRSAWYPLQGLGKFLVAQKAISVDPTVGIALPKKDAPLRPMPPDAELAAILAACDRIRHPRKAALYRALFSTLIYTGVRAQECLDIRVEHVDHERRTLTIHAGKGSKTRILHPCPDWWTAMGEWLLQREEDCRHPYLWAQDRLRGHVAGAR
jgi:site-specific recombinase XerD